MRAGERMRLRKSQIARVWNYPTSGEAGVTRPFNIGLVDDHHRLAVERRTNRLDAPGSKGSRLGYWASTDTQFDVRLPKLESSGSSTRAPDTVINGPPRLDAPPELIHARCQLQDRVVVRRQIDAGEQIDGFVRPRVAARGSRHPVERRPPLIRLRVAFRITIRPRACCRRWEPRGLLRAGGERRSQAACE